MQLADELIPTRTTLLERLKDWRDDPSWREFFDIYWELIYGLAIKSGLTEAEAQDVVQETMISVAKHISEFKYDKNVGSFKCWLLKMTRWRILDQFRRREAVAVHSNDETTIKNHLINCVPDPTSEDLEKFWKAEGEKVLLKTAVAKVKRQLDPEKYQIFDFLVNKEWPPKKVAKTFKISVNQVYLAKYRITELIKEQVRQLNDTMF